MARAKYTQLLNEELNGQRVKGKRRWPHVKYSSFNEKERLFIEEVRTEICREVSEKTDVPWQRFQIPTSWVLRAILEKAMGNR